MLVEKFLAFTLLGAEWVLWLLVGLSIVSVAIMIERWLYFSQRKVDLDALTRDVKRALSTGEGAQALDRWAQTEAIEAVVARAGLREAGRGAAAASEAMTGAKARSKQRLESNLTFLATVGNNAPFIGLFGTVLGIIRAFRDLSIESQTASKAVMAGISEALVATAVGLLVAIPAVLAFNLFNRRVRTTIASTDAIAHEILTELEGGRAREAA